MNPEFSKSYFEDVNRPENIGDSFKLEQRPFLAAQFG